MIGLWLIVALTGVTHPMPPVAAYRPSPASVSAKGTGYPPRHMRGAQARLMARRAAEVVAVRNLAAKLGVPPGGHVPSFRYVEARELKNGAFEVTVETTVGRTPQILPGNARPNPTKTP